MAKRSCGIRSLPMCGATVATKGDENLDASATGERGAGTNSGVSITPLTTGPVVGLLASWLCSTKMSDGAIAKTPTPNPARIKANPATLLMTNRTCISTTGISTSGISTSGRRALTSPTGDQTKAACSIYAGQGSHVERGLNPVKPGRNAFGV